MGACCSEEPSVWEAILDAKPMPVKNYGSTATREQRAAYNDYVHRANNWQQLVRDYNAECDRQQLLYQQRQQCSQQQSNVGTALMVAGSVLGSGGLFGAGALTVATS